ncbi:MAG: NAD(P)H-dependent oxidoreductase [Bacteroidales bacterium]|nr:NAD(P)H-dependent oxidoreductase [Bacteroidales bacterium]
MNILVINGSPKGDNSITLHTCLYLAKRFPELEFSFLHAGQKIKALEKDFSPALELLRKADLLLFCYPVYTFLVPYQLHRFIELMKASGEDFSGKAATQVTTSKHFYDVTAHRFIKDNCADMGLRYFDGLSADMEDLLNEKGRSQAEAWMKYLLWQMNGGADAKPAAAEKKEGLRPVVVADLQPGDTRLKEMIDRFIESLPYRCDFINIAEFPFMGGCLSCFSCASDGKCIYKDGFDDFLRNKIHTHDAIIYAFRIQDHSMGSTFKLYDDRQFCNGHRTVTMGTPFGYLVEGEYSKEENLRLLLEARAQVGGTFLAGVASDEADWEIEVDRLASTVCYAMETRYTPPQNFLGVGGMKIFRDLIYKMRGLMRADHKFFKSHGQYDFPQKEWKTSIAMYFVGWLMGNKKIRLKLGGKMSEEMIAPYKKVISGEE